MAAAALAQIRRVNEERGVRCVCGGQGGGPGVEPRLNKDGEIGLRKDWNVNNGLKRRMRRF